MTGVTRLDHAVLFVRDADVAAEFYRTAFGLEELERPPGMRAVFMRSPSGGNHHVPADAWGEDADRAVIRPLDLGAELRRWSSGPGAAPA